MGEMLRGMTPEKLKTLNEKQLLELCAEIRARLVETVTENGGHLASNLGAVELTVALHRALSCPKDKLVFDVGHQCYVHKLLTGREDRFSSLRTIGGLSGFPNRAESEYDAFGAGHSSTSISAALGMAHARDLSGGDNCVVAVIGDGALTGGMAYEALNDAGRHKSPLIVVLNDNDMSIAKNVGALQLYLTRLRSKKGYLSLKRRVSGRWPRLAARLERVRNSIKYFILPSTFFEELGFKYFGPIDGHDIAAVESVIKQAKRINAPVLVHVVTQKGKGLADAENSPEEYHGVAPFFTLGGGKKPNEKDNSRVFGEKLCELARGDGRIVAVTAAMPQGTGLSAFAQEFPNRFFDVGIAEQHAVTMCAGMAAEGLRPVFAVYSSFMQRAYDQLIHDVCVQKLPVVFAVDRSGPVGEDGPTHHGSYDIGYLTQAPGLVVASPSTKCELRAMLEQAFTLDRPYAIRYGRGALPEGEPCGVQLGRFEIINKIAPVSVVSTGRMVEYAREAVAALAKRGVVCGLINARFLKPLDTETIAQLDECKGVVVVEDGVESGGLAEHIAIITRAKVKSLSLPDAPLQAARFSEQLELAHLTAADIAAAVEEMS